MPQIFPGAKLRTYAGGTATFVRGMLLITAHYGEVRDGVELLTIDERAEELLATGAGQGSLFAA